MASEPFMVRSRLLILMYFVGPGTWNAWSYPCTCFKQAVLKVGGTRGPLVGFGVPSLALRSLRSGSFMSWLSLGALSLLVMLHVASYTDAPNLLRDVSVLMSQARLEQKLNMQGSRTGQFSEVAKSFALRGPQTVQDC